MKKLLLIALLAAFASATTVPTLRKVLGFGTTHAYAQNNDDQGENCDGDGDC